MNKYFLYLFVLSLSLCSCSDNAIVSKEVFNAMHDIYNGMKTTLWLKKWENCKEKEDYISILKKEKEWCTGNNINFTPEILINGKGYPKEYDKTDLHYFMEELIEQ